MMMTIINSSIRLIEEDEQEIVSEGPRIVEGLRLISSATQLPDEYWMDVIRWGFSNLAHHMRQSGGSHARLEQAWREFIDEVVSMAPESVRNSRYNE